MAHAQKPDFVFRLNGRVHLNPGVGGGGGGSVDYWKASCADRPAAFVLHMQACVLQWCDSYWFPLHSIVSPSLLPPCVTVCHHISNAVYHRPVHKHHTLSPVLYLYWCLQVYDTVHTGRRVGSFGEEHTDYILLNMRRYVLPKRRKLRLILQFTVRGKATAWILVIVETSEFAWWLVDRAS